MAYNYIKTLDCPAPKLPHTVIFKIGEFDEYQFSEVLDPYKISPAQFNKILEKKFKGDGNVVADISLWFIESGIAPRVAEFITHYRVDQSSFILGIRFVFQTAEDALMFRMKWI